MLVRFNVKNFLSFACNEDGNSQEFSMIAGKVKNKPEHTYEYSKLKLLKLACIYGANASGKSNLVKAIHFMKDTVINGIPLNCYESYCKSNLDNKDKKSYLEFEILYNEKCYAYGFEIILSKGTFVSEWLIELSSNSDKVIYTRDIVNGEYQLGTHFKNSNLRKKLDVYIDDIKNDGSALFLTIMNQNKNSLYAEYDEIQILNRVFNWVKNDLNIIYPYQPISNYEYMSDNRKIEEVCSLLNSFGTGITGFNISDISFEKVLLELPVDLKEMLKLEISQLCQLRDRTNNPQMENLNFILRTQFHFIIININKQNIYECKSIKFSHSSNKDILFNISEESLGTQRVLDLIEILICGRDKTYIIDELDCSLHPSLTYNFIEKFIELTQKNKIQLIVTTHESRLLDFNLLRRDEIWFINKNNLGESDIYSLEEYNTRFDLKIDKAYLEGRYGGVPIFTTLFPIEEIEYA